VLLKTIERVVIQDAARVHSRFIVGFVLIDHLFSV